MGAVLVEGPKACGKTETALQLAASAVRFDTDPNAKAMLELNPDELFNQDLPILFDEWQRAPAIWDHVRRHVDEQRRKGLYVLTGSATPNDSRELHSGAGRIGTPPASETINSCLDRNWRRRDASRWRARGADCGARTVEPRLAGSGAQR